MSSIVHSLAKTAWSMSQDMLVAASPPSCGCCAGRLPRVYFGGARAGSSGGPQVKVGLLQSRFPQHRFDFNLVYLSSGALYLSAHSYQTLRARGIPVVVNQNGVFFPAWYPHGWKRENERMGRALETASHVFFQSAFCRDAVTRFVGVEPRSSEILYNAVDTKTFHVSDRPPIVGRPIRLLMTGAVGKTQANRLLSVIDGVAKARQGGLNVVLDVYGDVHAEVMTQAAVQIDRHRMGSEVIFCGAYTRSQAPSLYAAADIYVTNKFNDNCPNAVLEALSSALPVLYSSSGGVPELVGQEAGAGLEVPKSFDEEFMPTADDFAQGLERIIANHPAMSRAARERAVARFDLAAWLERHNEVFLECLERCS